MQQDLNKMFTFAFLPFSLIGRVINKVLWKNIKAMILVTPTWQTQPWYTLLLRMSIQRPLLLPALPYLLLHLQGEKHSDRELKIAAWKITQKPGNGRNFKQCSQTGLHIQKTRFYSRLRIGGNKWVSWCCQQQIDRFCAPWSERLNYLSTLFEKDLQYRTINSHRYAISAYHGSQFISAYHDLQLTVVW